MAGEGGFIENLMSGILGDAKRPDAGRPELGVPMLAHWLPYRSYDAKTGIFYNSASRGFVVEAAPLIGADERTGEILTQFLSEAIPAPGCLQFHQWMSPRVGERLSKWYLPRYAARGVYERMAKHRVDFLTLGCGARCRPTRRSRCATTESPSPIRRQKIRASRSRRSLR